MRQYGQHTLHNACAETCRAPLEFAHGAGAAPSPIASTCTKKRPSASLAILVHAVGLLAVMPPSRQDEPKAALYYVIIMKTMADALDGLAVAAAAGDGERLGMSKI